MSKLKENVKLIKINKDINKQEILTAIVFTDDFSCDLKWIEDFYPSALFPLVTTPLLNYLMETLVRSKIQQVYLYSTNHIEKVKAHLEALRKYYKDIYEDSITITPILSDGCRSLGDALRDIDTKGFIRSDFILIRANAFTNANLRALIDTHKLRKEKDKKLALTMVLRDIGNVKDSFLKKNSSLVVSNANTKKLFHYNKFPQDNKKIDLDLEWFLDNDKVHINSGLIDTHIYVCSASVLPLFADNFDFQTMEDFIRGALMNEEFMESTIYWEQLNQQSYALPMTSWDAYRTISRDILQRHCYPLAPDTLPYKLRNFIYMSRSTYKHSTSILSKGCILETESIVGQDSCFKEDSYITKSVIGTNCSGGKNVKIENSYLLSEIIISDHCNIKDSIIFPNCIIAQGTKLNKCIVLPNIQLIEVNQSFENVLFGSDKNGKVTFTSLSSTDCPWSNSFINNEDRSCENQDDDDASSSSSLSRSSLSLHSSRDSPVPPQDDNDIFLSEVIDSLLRGYQDKVKSENLILEINSSRYAYNVNIRQVSYNVVKAILILPFHHAALSNNNDSASKDISTIYQKTLSSMIAFFQSIFKNYIKTDDAQEDCLQAIQNVANTNQETLLPYAKNLLLFLYRKDILSEEKILNWYEDGCRNSLSNDEGDLEGKNYISEAMKTALAPFIKWLKEAEEDSSSSSSS